MIYRPDFDHEPFKPNGRADAPPPKESPGFFLPVGECAPEPALPTFQFFDAFVESYKPPEYLLDHVFVSGSLYTITAATGTGKTAVLILLMLAIIPGRADLMGIKVKRGRVLVVCAEDPEGFKARLIVAAWAFGISWEGLSTWLVIVEGSIKPEAIISLANKLSEDGEFALIVGDTLQALFDGKDANNPIEVGGYFRRWREARKLPGSPAVIIAAHPPKGAPNLLPAGSMAATNEIDGNATLAPEGSSGLVRLHWEGKFRGRFEPMLWRFEMLTAPMVTWKDGTERKLPVLFPATMETAEERQRAEGNTDGALLLSMIAEPGGTQQQWSETVGRSKRAESRLKCNNTFKVLARG
jgi:hypothetical protein